MARQGECAPMHRQEGTAAQQIQRVERVLGSEMHVAPRRMVAADLQHHEVEPAEALADRAVLRRQAGIAAEEHRVPRRADDHRRPQRGVAVPQPAPREMLRRPGRDRKPGIRQRVGFPPVELGDLPGRHAPGFQVHADAEGRDEGHATLRQLAHGCAIEVVVVVVRDDDGVDRRQRAQGDRHRLEPLRPEEPERRCARPPHRVGQDPVAVDLDEDGGVSEPRGAQAGARRARPGKARIDRGQSAARSEALAAEEDFQNRRTNAGVPKARQYRMNITEPISAPHG
jgi:hypothetical protein